MKEKPEKGKEEEIIIHRNILKWTLLEQGGGGDTKETKESLPITCFSFTPQMN